MRQFNKEHYAFEETLDGKSIANSPIRAEYFKNRKFLNMQKLRGSIDCQVG